MTSRRSQRWRSQKEEDKMIVQRLGTSSWTRLIERQCNGVSERGKPFMQSIAGKLISHHDDTHYAKGQHSLAFDMSLSPRSSILVIIRYIFCCLCVRAVNISAPLLLLFRRTRLFPQSLCRPVNRLCPVTVTVWHGNKLHFLSISRTRQGCKRKGRLKRDGITKVNCRYYLVNCILG